MSLCLILLILSKTDLMHIGNTEIFYLIIVQPTPEPEIRIIIMFEYSGAGTMGHGGAFPPLLRMAGHGGGHRRRMFNLIQYAVICQ